ncbi:hypothetical protein B0H14DRAFT_2743405, partial [Mycena olivaceomarginata]
GGGWAGAAHFSVLVGVHAPCSCCLCVRALAGPGDWPRGDAFCPVVAGCPATAGSVLYFAGWWRIQCRVASDAEGATLSDSRGAWRSRDVRARWCWETAERQGVQGCPPSPDNKAARAHDGDSLL